ncbi:MAG: PAS domain-containing protein [Thermoplasmatales archaeon]|nr:PAS domain-containing protein [Thermoplasmatales archaeon]MCK5636713.1 PAS domain-containing protein [Thermoplasmatales archaeon]
MEKKTIFLELPSKMIARIDEQNTVGDRSVFISELIDKQLQTPVSEMDVSTEIPTTMQTGQPILDEVEKLTWKDGSERWVSVTKIPRYNQEGEIIGTMGVSRNVTKRIKGTKETEKYKKVAIGQNLRMIELRDKVKDLITEMEKEQ